MIACEYLEGLKTKDVLSILRKAIEKYRPPEKVLVDNCSQFLDIFREVCKELGIEVERAIRNFNEEYLRLQKVFDSVEELLSEFVRWYNYERYHMGIDGIPAERYFVKVVKNVR